MSEHLCTICGRVRPDRYTLGDPEEYGGWSVFKGLPGSTKYFEACFCPKCTTELREHICKVILQKKND